MKRITALLLGSLVATLASVGVSCRDTQEANSVVLEPQETIIVNTEKSERSTANDTSDAAREIPRKRVSPESSDGFENDQSQMTTQLMVDRQITLGERFQITLPSRWVAKPPAVSLIEYEFAVPTSVAGEPDGRLTFMAARGGVNANIERWIKQFRIPPGRDKNQAIVREQRDVAGQKVHLLDISGTYLESSGPMMERVAERENYRMLGAIIECQDGFLYFIKFYGPERTVAENKAAFIAMIQSLRKLDSE